MTGPSKPTAVIFDVGNVLYGWDPEAFLVRQIADDEERLRFIEDTNLWDWHESLDAGRPFDEAAHELTELYPAYAAMIAAWGSRFGETIKGPIEPVHRIVEELDAAGVPLFAITNFSADFWPPFRAANEAFFARFRDIVVSGEEKLLKPDPAIYWLALDRFGLRPEDGLFVDDRQINVDGAEAIGLRAHLFTDAEGLRARLVDEGLVQPNT